MPLTLTVHGGNREIGGNKILVETPDGGIFLDFGKSYGIEDQYYEVPWNPPFGIPGLLNVHALPDIPGLYRHDPGPHRYAVAITHPHMDHVGYASLLAPGTPIITGHDTKNLIDIRLETTRGSWDAGVAHLDWRTVRTGDIVDLPESGLRIEPVHVDHSVPASYGFVVEAEGLRIGYTGDIRMHGARPDLTVDFLQRLAAKPLDILICEGTYLRPDGADPDAQFLQEMASMFRLRMGEDAPQQLHTPCATEQEVRDALEAAMKESQGLVLIEVSPLDVDRMRSVWQAALSARRRVVLPSRQAYLLQQSVARTSIGQLPPLYGSALLLSQRRMAQRDRLSGHPEPVEGPGGGFNRFLNEDAETETKGRERWEQALCEDWRANGGDVYWGLEGRAELRNSPDRYVIVSPQCGAILPELAYRATPCPITFILSKSEPFNEEMLLSFDRLLHWLRFFGCPDYRTIHVSGHAPKADLAKIIESANPGLLVPVHTRFPELMHPYHDNLRVPALDGSVSLQ